MILLVHGEDDFLVGRRKRSLQQTFAKKYPEGEIFVFDFEDQGSLASVKQALDACEGGLFATEKMVIFLHPFALHETGEKLLISFLQDQVATLPEHTILLFVHTGKLKKTHPVTKVLLKKMDKEEVCTLPEGARLRQFLKTELSRIHDSVTISDRAIEMLLSLSGSTARMLGELEKLVLYKGEGVIEAEDVALLLEVPQETNIWKALDALGRGDREQALLLFRKETKKTDQVYQVLSMCAWQVRRLLLIREAFDQGIRTPGEIASYTKLPPFTVQKALPAIQRFSLARMKKGLGLLSEIDTALKQGKADPLVSLDLFVWKF
jgi:DNA polymerase III delta subunit